MSKMPSFKLNGIRYKICPFDPPVLLHSHRPGHSPHINFNSRRELFLWIKNQRSKSRGFTLMECMVACLIIGIMTSMALVGYSKTIEWATERQVKTDMQAIQSALRIYALTKHVVWPKMPVVASLNEINETTDMHLIEPPNIKYFCHNQNGTVICEGKYKTKWYVAMAWIPTINNTKTFCEFGPCPTCKLGGC